MQALCNADNGSPLTRVDVGCVQRGHMLKDGQVLFKILYNLTKVICRPAMIFKAAGYGLE